MYRKGSPGAKGHLLGIVANIPRLRTYANIFFLSEQPDVSARLASVNEMDQAARKVWLTRRWQEKILRQLIKQHTRILNINKCGFRITKNHEQRKRKQNLYSGENNESVT